MEYEQLINFRNNRNHFAKKTGIRTIDIAEGYAECEMDLEANHFNVINVVSGGALFTLMDAVGGATAASYGYRVTTLSSNIFFLHSVKKPMRLYGVGRTIKHGKKLTVVDVRVEDVVGKIYAQGTLTYLNLDTPIN